MRVENDITGTLRKETRGHEPVIAFGLDEEQNGHEEVMGCLKARVAGGGLEGAVAFAQNQLGEVRTGEVTNTLNQNSNASGRNTPMVQASMQVRRLTPKECCRLQGFPDTYLSQVTFRGKCPPADGVMYKALGNSMAGNVMSWIGQRIDMVDKLTHPRQPGTKGEAR